MIWGLLTGNYFVYLLVLGSYFNVAALSISKMNGTHKMEKPFLSSEQDPTGVTASPSLSMMVQSCLK